MALNIGAVATALCTAVAGVTSTSATGSKKLRTKSFLPLTINTPGFYVAERILPRHGSMGRGAGAVDGQPGSTGSTFMCRLYAAPHSDDRTGAALLDEFMASDGATSVSAALEADPKLGGVCQASVIRGIEGYAIYVANGDAYIGSQWRMEVW